MKDIKTAYAYARFSSDNQREESIDAQLRAIREYCRQNGIVLLREFRDEAVSGRTDKRPSFQELFALIREEPADFLIVHKLDRFARNRYDAALYRKKLTDAGMKLVSVLERLDDSPESIILEGLLESLNEYYSANLSRETKKGLRENVLQGKRNGGRPPIGYRIEGKKLVPNEDADRVRSVFRMYADGASYMSLSRETGFSYGAIRYILGNEAYTGLLKGGEVNFENAHEPLIDRETFERCQERRKSKRNAANKSKADYALTGIAFCEKCGKPMVGFSTNGYLYYYCRTKGCKMRRKEELEQKVTDKLKTFFAPTDEIKARFYALVSERVNNQAKIEEVRKGNIIISKRISNLKMALEMNPDPETAQELIARVQELRSQIRQEPKPREISREVCDAYIEQFAEQLNGDSLIIRNFVAKAVIGDDISLYIKLNSGVDLGEYIRIFP